MAQMDALLARNASDSCINMDLEEGEIETEDVIVPVTVPEHPVKKKHKRNKKRNNYPAGFLYPPYHHHHHAEIKTEYPRIVRIKTEEEPIDLESLRKAVLESKKKQPTNRSRPRLSACTERLVVPFTGLTTCAGNSAHPFNSRKSTMQDQIERMKLRIAEREKQLTASPGKLQMSFNAAMMCLLYLDRISRMEEEIVVLNESKEMYQEETKKISDELKATERKIFELRQMDTELEAQLIDINKQLSL